jgi:hypothetical protein
VIPRYRILHERIDAEFVDVQRAADKAAGAYHEAQRDSQHASSYRAYSFSCLEVQNTNSPLKRGTPFRPFN